MIILIITLSIASVIGAAHVAEVGEEHDRMWSELRFAWDEWEEMRVDSERHRFLSQCEHCDLRADLCRLRPGASRIDCSARQEACVIAAYQRFCEKTGECGGGNRSEK